MSQPAGQVARTEVEKPTAAFILSVIAGIFLTIGGLLQLGLALAASVLLSFIGLSGAGLVAVAVVGVIIGIAVISLGALLYVRPREHVVLGVLVLVLSIVGVYTSFFGGFAIGLILGIVGGALGIAHKPKPIPEASQPARMCPRCGRSIDFRVKFCPHCGAEVG